MKQHISPSPNIARRNVYVIGIL